MVDKIDNQRSFQMFDAGWILPPNQRRGGRAPVERQALPPPRKRARLDRGTSRLSVFSTAASENQTLNQSSSSASGEKKVMTSDAVEDKINRSMEVDNDDASRAAEDITTVDTAAEPVSALRSPQQRTVIPPGTVIQTKNGTIIIEELDTPAIRREKAIRRKEERLRLAAAAEPDSAPPPSSSVLVARPPRKSRATKGMDDIDNELDSDLSSLSDVGSDVGSEDGKPRAESTAGATNNFANAAEESGDISVNETLEGGTLVWAKAETYPWWPAVVFEEDDPEVPDSVYNACIAAQQKQKGVIHVVRFFDKASSWQCLNADRVKLLGEDKALDEDLLSPTPRTPGQRWRNAKIRQECRAAWRRAMAEMETGSNPEQSEDEGDGNGVSET